MLWLVGILAYTALMLFLISTAMSLAWGLFLTLALIAGLLCAGVLAMGVFDEKDDSSSPD